MRYTILLGVDSWVDPVEPQKPTPRDNNKKKINKKNWKILFWKNKSVRLAINHSRWFNNRISKLQKRSIKTRKIKNKIGGGYNNNNNVHNNNKKKKGHVHRSEFLSCSGAEVIWKKKRTQYKSIMGGNAGNTNRNQPLKNYHIINHIISIEMKNKKTFSNRIDFLRHYATHTYHHPPGSIQWTIKGQSFESFFLYCTC